MKKWFWIAGIAVAVGVLLLIQSRNGEAPSPGELAIAQAKRGALPIRVLENGNVRALEVYEVKNDIKAVASLTIAEIVEEGYEIAQQDIENKKVILRFDSSELEERLVNQSGEYQQVMAAYLEAAQEIDIEKSEAQSAIKAERQDIRFALLDFQKFVGSDAADELLAKLGLPANQEAVDAYEENETKAIASAFDPQEISRSPAKKGEVTQLPSLADAFADSGGVIDGIDFQSLIEENVLGDGEAEQKIRRMRDEALVAASQLSVVKESVEGAQRLAEREFITRQTLENELVSLDKAKLNVVRSQTDLDLFKDYDFPKEAERLLSDYEESLNSLIRTKRERMAMISQRYARFASSERRYQLEKKRLREIEQQIEDCVVYATVPGFVAYGDAKNRSFYRRQTVVEEGATINRGATVLTIPSPDRLGVDLNIHESNIKKIATGQKVVVELESEPDKTFAGEVSRVSVLPDSNASRYNPSLRVYPVTVELDDTSSGIKPGMSAKVTVLVDELEDVIFVPIQAISVEEGAYYIHRIKTGSKLERVEVKIGPDSDGFVQVVEGIQEGDDVVISGVSLVEEAEA